jgi:hypothetical protein
LEFISPTKGRLTFDQVFQEILGYASLYPDDHYRLIIGTIRPYIKMDLNIKLMTRLD